VKREGSALLVVLFIVMAITILSLGFLSRSDVELACGENMILRTQMDYLAESGLEHARGLILNPQEIASGYWTGAAEQQLVDGSDDYYDVNVVKDVNGECNYRITCDAYRRKNGEKIGRSSLKAELRLDPCIAFWTKTDTTISNNINITGDVYCNGTLTNNGTINGDVFASGGITNESSGSISGQIYANGIKQIDVNCPNLAIGDFPPSDVCVPDANNGNVELIDPNLTVNGTLAVGCNLVIHGGTIKITAPKNSPALLVGNKLTLENGAVLEVDGFAQITEGISIESGAKFEISGSLFIVGIGGISDGGQVIITADPVKASFLLPPGNQVRWSPVGGAFFKSIGRP